MKTLLNLADKEEILRRLNTVQPASQRRWGSMSAHNMICHLSDGFRLYMGERLAKSISVPTPRALTERFTRQPRDFDWKPHPHFGEMSEREWNRLAYLHADHHLRQFGA